MSIELLYTSATAGLRQGSRGFCTVLATAGMPASMMQRLETLSGYRHVFSPQDAQSASNPVGHSQLRIRTGGTSTSVLSRIAAYGTDYSGRTNKLAHHVVVPLEEQSPAGPAWVLAHANVMRTQWAGEKQTPANGPAIAMQNQSPRVCQTWAAITGDAGWGGRVADAFCGTSTKPLWIVFDLAQSPTLLTLIDESIALLPESQRWAATFSTYYTNLPPEVECRVRCVLAGSEEAKLAAARGTVIDLTTRTPLTAATLLIELARTGVAASVARTAAPIPTPNQTETPLNVPITPTSPPAGAQPVDDIATIFDLPPSPQAIDSGPPIRIQPPPPRSNSRRKQNKSHTLAAVGIALFLLLVGGAVFAISRVTRNRVAMIEDLANPDSITGRNSSPSAANTEQPRPENETANQAANQAKATDEMFLPLKGIEGKLNEIKIAAVQKKPRFDAGDVPDLPSVVADLNQLLTDHFDKLDVKTTELDTLREKLTLVQQEDNQRLLSKETRELLQNYVGSPDEEKRSGLYAFESTLQQTQEKANSYQERCAGAKRILEESKTQLEQAQSLFDNYLAEIKVPSPTAKGLRDEIETRLIDVRQQIDSGLVKLSPNESEITTIQENLDRDKSTLEDRLENSDKALVSFNRLKEIESELEGKISLEEQRIKDLAMTLGTITLIFRRQQSGGYLIQHKSLTEYPIELSDEITGLQVNAPVRFVAVEGDRTRWNARELSSVPCENLTLEIVKKPKAMLRVGFEANSNFSKSKPRCEHDRQCQVLFSSLEKLEKHGGLIGRWTLRPTFGAPTVGAPTVGASGDGNAKRKEKDPDPVKLYNDLQNEILQKLGSLGNDPLGQIDDAYLLSLDGFLERLRKLPANENIMVEDNPSIIVRAIHLSRTREACAEIIEARDFLTKPFEIKDEMKIYLQTKPGSGGGGLLGMKADIDKPALTIQPRLVLEVKAK